MTISGFTFLRNAHKLYYPVLESINSILGIVDEFVIALGEGDADDTTMELLKSSDSDKIKIVYSQWDTEKYPNGTVYAQQTDLAKQHCSGDWLFYLQGDEVIHEDDLAEIVSACNINKNKRAQSIYNNTNQPDNIDYFDYGRMDYCSVFEQTHPAVMATVIPKHNWAHLLRYSGPNVIGRPASKHEKMKYRILSFIENKLLGGYVLGGFKNYKLLKP
jgi:uncharacterized protein YuzB (UPF0349 family)